MTETLNAQTGKLSIIQQAALGIVDGLSYVYKFGYNADVDIASDPEDVWLGGGLYTGFPTQTETVSAVSTSVNDTLFNTGANNLVVEGLDADGNLQTDTIVMNGTNTVTGSLVFSRVFRAYPLAVGSAGSNVGTITINHSTTTANVFATIAPGIGQTQVAAYTVPKGYKALLIEANASVTRTSGAAGSAVMALVTKDGGIVSAPERSRIYRTAASTFPAHIEFHGGQVLPELTDIVWRVVEVSDDNTRVSGDFELLLIKTSV